MKILKKGETIPFECNCCGCQFVVGINSIENKDGNFYANCPCCGSDCHTDWARISSAKRENEKSESTAGKLRNERKYIVKYSNNALQLLPDVMQELVRCKDCTFRGEINCPQYYRKNELSDDYFCADGERKDGKQE